MDIRSRFWSKVHLSDGCWLWTGALGWNGYGVFSYGPRRGQMMVRAHRWSWEQVHGPIPKGQTIDHTCHDARCHRTDDCPHRRCVNPSHMRLSTMRENVLRGNTITARNAAKTRCPRDHVYDAVNANGRRICTQCSNEASRRYHARKVAGRNP